MAQISGRGTLIAFAGTVGWTPKYISIGGVNISREDLQTSYLGQSAVSGVYWHTYIPDPFVEPGEIECEFFWEPENTIIDIATGAAGTITLTYANTDASTVAASGYAKVTNIGPAEIGSLLRGTLTAKLSGAITYTV